MVSDKSEALRTALGNQIRRLNKRSGRLEKLSSRISMIRFFFFLAGMALLFMAARSGSVLLFTLTLLSVTGVFVGLVTWHRKVDEALQQFSGWITIRSRHLARMNLDWADIPSAPTEEPHRDHPFARDFDITGKHSLLQLMDTTTYPQSRERLKQWLLNRHPERALIKQRQRLVKELRPMARFRDRLHLNAAMARKNESKYEWSMDELLQWLRSSRKGGFALPLAILGTLSAVNIALLILYLLGFVGPYVILSFAIYLLAYNFYSEKVSGLFEEASQINALLARFRSILNFLESYPYPQGSALREFCSLYHEEERRPSRYLKKIIRLSAAASSQSSELIWLVINGLLPWDLYFSMRLNAFKEELEPRLSNWLDHFHQLEALNAIANFGWLNPDYTFSLPRKDCKEPVIRARNLGHPLIPKERKVTNDITIEQTGDILLITGSNMAGKSTFLRTLGINLCLCFAGAPVNATTFETILFRIFSSINVTDSLDEGLSHFYAEVKHLRAMLDELTQPHELPLFFLVDEIYRGTNNRERLAGSAAFLKKVAGKDGVGLVSTHDLELARLEEQIPSLTNWHFEETIEDGKMRFEYKLKRGPCPSTNALKIMQMEGLPVD